MGEEAILTMGVRHYGPGTEMTNPTRISLVPVTICTHLEAQPVMPKREFVLWERLPAPIMLLGTGLSLRLRHKETNQHVERLPSSGWKTPP